MDEQRQQFLAHLVNKFFEDKEVKALALEYKKDDVDGRFIPVTLTNDLVRHVTRFFAQYLENSPQSAKSQYVYTSSEITDAIFRKLETLE